MSEKTTTLVSDATITNVVYDIFCGLLEVDKDIMKTTFLKIDNHDISGYAGSAKRIKIVESDELPDIYYNELSNDLYSNSILSRNANSVKTNIMSFLITDTDNVGENHYITQVSKGGLISMLHYKADPGALYVISTPIIADGDEESQGDCLDYGEIEITRYDNIDFENLCSNTRKAVNIEAEKVLATIHKEFSKDGQVTDRDYVLRGLMENDITKALCDFSKLAAFSQYQTPDKDFAFIRDMAALTEPHKSVLAFDVDTDFESFGKYQFNEGYIPVDLKFHLDPDFYNSFISIKMYDGSVFHAGFSDLVTGRGLTARDPHFSEFMKLTLKHDIRNLFVELTKQYQATGNINVKFNYLGSNIPEPLKNKTPEVLEKP